MQLGNIAGLLSKHSWGLSNFGIILPKSKTLSINKNNYLNPPNLKYQITEK
mgnify:CR=1 FL=1